MGAIKTVGVVGAGTMGSGIAHVAAQSGCSVIIAEAQESQLERAQKYIGEINRRNVEKGRLSEAQAEEMMGRMRFVQDLSALSAADICIEAIYEDLEAKKEVFRQLDKIARPGVILATNTSSMSITEIGRATARPERTVGLHFFNPAQVMKLVEVVRGYYTSDETMQEAQAFAQALGKTAIAVQKDQPGFVVNRVLMPLLAEACKVVEEGVATVEDVDTAVKLGLNHPMGPFTLLDFTGIDVCYAVMEYFYREFGDPAYKPPLLLHQLVRAGRMGKKSGAGFYEYQ
ncbi:MAG: 3-hydroxyacyl-CoA dehydrogenase family protein [Thermaerobacter sp.]|nr:3-hydroxyacyl-CoA dehydrogenase family protein [Thermaerobacter sp.]